MPLEPPPYHDSEMTSGRWKGWLTRAQRLLAVNVDSEGGHTTFSETFASNGESYTIWTHTAERSGTLILKLQRVYSVDVYVNDLITESIFEGNTQPPPTTALLYVEVSAGDVVRVDVAFRTSIAGYSFPVTLSGDLFYEYAIGKSSSWQDDGGTPSPDKDNTNKEWVDFWIAVYAKLRDRIERTEFSGREFDQDAMPSPATVGVEVDLATVVVNYNERARIAANVDIYRVPALAAVQVFTLRIYENGVQIFERAGLTLQCTCPVLLYRDGPATGVEYKLSITLTSGSTTVGVNGFILVATK